MQSCGSRADIYVDGAKFGGMAPSEANRLKTLEDENARLKRLLAETMLDNTALKDLVVSRMLWKLPGSMLRAREIGSVQAARSSAIGSRG